MTKKILIVDDEKDIAQLIAFRLQAHRYKTILAHDGVDGLAKAKEENPDLVILDVMMPRLNGFEVCRLLKFDAKYKNIPVIFLTSKKEDVDKAISQEVGADAYVTKPFESNELIETIGKILQSKDTSIPDA